MIKFNILFRACEKERRDKTNRPYGLNKTQIIKVSFYSIYQAIQGMSYKFVVVGDDLSQGLLNFFSLFDDIIIDNDNLGSASKSLQKQIDLALEVSDEEWVYMCEDDYLHTPYSFQYISEFLENKEQYIKTSGGKKNYMNRLIGDLSSLPIVIHTPDYPDRYKPNWKRLSFIFLSKYCHWRQITNTTHTILLQSSTIKKFEKHIKASSIGPSDSILSKKIYGRIFLKNKALCVSPIKGLSSHMHEGVMTPLVDWKEICQDNIHQLKQKNLW